MLTDVALLWLLSTPPPPECGGGEAAEEGEEEEEVEGEEEERERSRRERRAEEEEEGGEAVCCRLPDQSPLLFETTAPSGSVVMTDQEVKPEWYQGPQTLPQPCATSLGALS